MSLERFWREFSRANRAHKCIGASHQDGVSDIDACTQSRPATPSLASPGNRSGATICFQYWTYCDSLVIASAALPATTQLADPPTTASSSNQRNPKSSMHSGKSGLIMMYPGITAPGM